MFLRPPLSIMSPNTDSYNQCARLFGFRLRLSTHPHLQSIFPRQNAESNPAVINGVENEGMSHMLLRSEMQWPQQRWPEGSITVPPAVYIISSWSIFHVLKWFEFWLKVYFFFLPQFSFVLVRQLSHCHVCVRLSVLLWSNLHLIVLHKGTIKWIWRWISVHIYLMDSNKWSDWIWLKKKHTHITEQSDNFGPLIFFVSLWHLTNICGLHDLVISPQWSPFGFGPLVAPFWGVHTPSDTHK